MGPGVVIEQTERKDKRSTRPLQGLCAHRHEAASVGAPIVIFPPPGTDLREILQPPALRIGVEVRQLAGFLLLLHLAPEADGEEVAPHDLPSLAEIIDWLRYLTIQCPECQDEAL
jgi:hypothetical protein